MEEQEIIDNTNYESSYLIADIPEPSGYYQIGKQDCMQVHISPKPSWLARTMCRLLLDWYWCDNKTDKK